MVIDTATVEPKHRHEFWQDAVSRVYYPLEIEPPARPFSARVSRQQLWGIGMARITSSGLTTIRSTRSIARHDPATLTVIVCTAGRFVVEQDGRRALCEPGDLTTCDSSRSYVIRSLSPIEGVTYTIPKSLLRPYADRLARATATRLQPLGPLALVESFLCDLARRLERGEVGPDDEQLAESVLALTRRLAGDDGGGRAPAPELLHRIKAFIAANLGDPELGPEAIAGAHYISRRHLYNLFRSERSGVREWIQSRRLARCAADLRDPRLSHEPIQAIAARWGFRSPSHFSRSFRETYGCSPREYRASATGRA